MSRSHPSLGDPGDEVEYCPLIPFGSTPDELPPAIRVRVPLADIPTIFAHRQWRAGMLLADLIYSKSLPLENCDVLELGAGTALPSIAAHLYGNARSIVVTDYNSPSLVSTLRSNVKQNTSMQARSSIKPAGHTWANAIDDVKDLVPGEAFDAILLADCIWDELSHASLIKSVTSLLRKERQSRVFMVSGLHTGRSKIISFLRRAHRQGLRLVPFPLESKFDWPALIPSEIKVQERQSELYASDDALAQASQHIIEMQVLSHEMEESPLISSLNDGTRIWSAKTARLSNNRRAFVVEDRDEERDNTDGSVHFRNRWITFLALAWQK